MVNKKLLEEELKFYKDEFEPVKFNKDIIPSLLSKFNDYGMTENSFCCRGISECCWQDPIGEGIWDLSLETVKSCIDGTIKDCRKYLYNQKKYGKRFYMYEDNDYCYIYVYLRDIIQMDYLLWFNNENSIAKL